MEQTTIWDEMSEDELYSEIISRDWNIGHTRYSSYGVELILREHYTSDFPGMVTRSSAGKDRKEAMIRFLEEFGEEIESE